MADRWLGASAPAMIALEKGRRLIRHGERPVFHVAVDQEHAWSVLEAPWLSGAGHSRRHALLRARTAIAAWLDAPFEAFDVRRSWRLAVEDLHDTLERVRASASGPSGTAQSEETIGNARDLLDRIRSKSR